MDCIFCKIVKKEIPSKLVFEDDSVVAFEDISPQAKVHTLIIPKAHFPTLNAVDEKNISLLSKMYAAAQKIAKEKGVAESGYRCVINTNAQGGQTVFHLHLHLLAGEQLGGSMVG